ncbi:FKBP-type peptidyl-prolyl cis-trans isomerase [Streptomyces radicis]|uniref:peptidylprolyl isomerase n=1 Tax=Streptomyces radicis TaxID=1750517 RepID=A0A3A9WIV7_9ACTN|nr:FKBP-type peptidyl-prolyl cis-trans isomerase [Streptomyces radicis]RKN12760.1 FKBP-type peptidyl-prolyl cis-trans isomerase [Streptomyces radicis]RKN27476.1 FKBP-type peptidyl-prolyl cis-trans isomerase [Streptomyces radicis]
MIPIERARRLVVVLAVPALLLTAACGSDDGGSESSDPEGPVATVTGEAGEPPEITLEDGAQAGSESVVEVLSEGDGDEVQDGDFLRVDVVGRVLEADMELLNTWNGNPQAPEDAPRTQFVVQVGAAASMPEAATTPLVGTKVGSRVQVEGPVSDMLGPSAAQAGIEEDDGVVWVFDIAAASRVDPAAHAEGDQAAVDEGLPEVEAGETGPTITVPEGEDPPSELRQQTLIEGEGPEVETGDGLIAHYTGVLWDGGEMFDSSWEREMPSGFQIGTGSVVPGWDEGLAGKKVGDRVLLVIPPDLGYGDQEAGNGAIPAGSTLVFVVDIVGLV